MAFASRCCQPTQKAQQLTNLVRQDGFGLDWPPLWDTMTGRICCEISAAICPPSRRKKTRVTLMAQTLRCESF